ncbi:MAG: sialate O-acetylesterase [Chitinophagaceae bacterium]
MKFRLLIAAIISFVCLNNNPAAAQVKLPQIFGDSMVLQRDISLKIWGWSSAGEKVTVQLHNQSKTVNADAQGNWIVTLLPEKAGGPYSLQVKGNTSVTLNGILMGDVWVCSGQSNMEFPVSGWSGVYNAPEEIAAANYPSIRLFTIEKHVAALPVNDVKGSWQSCNPGSISPFSAVGYFFGRVLNQQLKVPIGLINTTWGGTNVETWISRTGFANDPYFKAPISSFPILNFDSLYLLRRQKMDALVKTLQPYFGDTTRIADWKDAAYNTSQWAQMKLPGLWESQQPGPLFDGLIWFRKEITVSDEDAGKPALLKLEMIDDIDETYVNGVKVGGINGYSQKRAYQVPANLLKKGRNVIAVRVEDTGGGGGIYGDSAGLVLSVNDHTYSLAGNWSFAIEAAKMAGNAIGPNEYPSLLYNGMVHPIIQLGIKGAIWYQGESNAGRAYEYRKAFPLLINDWRARWQQGNFPFYFVQLASFNSNNGNSNAGSNWAELREAQTMTLSLPNTGMAVTTDIGDAKDIHPRNKQDVGKRLAALALQHTYHIPVVSSGPVYKKMQVQGSSVVLDFAVNGAGMQSKNGDLQGFEIAGSDKKFYPAQAIIKGSQVIVSSTSVINPVAVRYGWADDAGNINLYNKEGFPASPFRTDTWKGITEGQHYQP